MKFNLVYFRFLIQRFFIRIFSLVFYLVKRLIGLVEILLFLRLLLKFFAANPQALIVKLIYQYSDILVSPFDFIFADIYWREYLIEIDTISAIVGYGLIILILFWLLKLLPRDR